MTQPSLRVERGSILILTVVMLASLLGITALSIDAAYMFETRNRMGAAADAAALAAAQELKRSAGAANLQTYANQMVVYHGFDPADGSTTVTVHSPPTSGSFSGVQKYVEVIISRPMSTFLARVIGFDSMTVGARAVAGPDDTSGCIYALSTTGNTKFPTSLDVNSATIHVPNCSVVSNQDLTVNGSSSINASNISVTGTATCLGTCTPAPQTAVPPMPDPLGDMNQASLFGTSWTCGWTGRNLTAGTNLSGTGQASLSGSASFELNPGVYCGDDTTPAIKIALQNNPSYTVTLNPGRYIINGGGLDWKHSYVNGSGVTFYLTATSGSHDYPACNKQVISTDAPDTFNLSAPTSGLYEGLLFIQDRTKGASCNASGQPVVANLVPDVFNIDGVIYFPTNNVTYGATTTGSGTYTVVIGDTVRLQGEATLGSNYTGLAGGSPVKKAATAE